MITQDIYNDLRQRAEEPAQFPVFALGYSVRRYLVDTFLAETVQAWPSGRTVLDVGGHKINKRGRFDITQYPLEVMVMNLTTEKQPDIQADGAQIPFPSAHFDYVICSELLEHVPHPPSVLEEIYRVLKPGGTCLITVPFLFHIHADPYDYGRYTESYWRLNLQSFQTVTLHKQGLFWSVLAEMIRLWLYQRVKHRRPRFLWLWRLVIGLLSRFQRWALRREATYSDESFYSSYVMGYALVCKK